MKMIRRETQQKWRSHHDAQTKGARTMVGKNFEHIWMETMKLIQKVRTHTHMLTSRKKKKKEKEKKEKKGKKGEKENEKEKE